MTFDLIYICKLPGLSWSPTQNHDPNSISSEQDWKAAMTGFESSAKNDISIQCLSCLTGSDKKLLSWENWRIYYFVLDFFCMCFASRWTSWPFICYTMYSASHVKSGRFWYVLHRLCLWEPADTHALFLTYDQHMIESKGSTINHLEGAAWCRFLLTKFFSPLTLRRFFLTITTSAYSRSPLALNFFSLTLRNNFFPFVRCPPIWLVND